MDTAGRDDPPPVLVVREHVQEPVHGQVGPQAHQKRRRNHGKQQQRQPGLPEAETGGWSLEPGHGHLRREEAGPPPVSGAPVERLVFVLHQLRGGRRRGGFSLPNRPDGRPGLLSRRDPPPGLRVRRWKNRGGSEIQAHHQQRQGRQPGTRHVDRNLRGLDQVLQGQHEGTVRLFGGRLRRRQGRPGRGSNGSAGIQAPDMTTMTMTSYSSARREHSRCHRASRVSNTYFLQQKNQQFNSCTIVFYF
mmetsp:Transcript_26691/g.58748  ORF Transcript_26691/g.58748 Transcript_26691/m.58748 type:complete len:247 (-) Transcript_26691:18-758(-)